MLRIFEKIILTGVLLQFLVGCCSHETSSPKSDNYADDSNSYSYNHESGYSSSNDQKWTLIWMKESGVSYSVKVLPPNGMDMPKCCNGRGLFIDRNGGFYQNFDLAIPPGENLHINKDLPPNLPNSIF